MEWKKLHQNAENVKKIPPLPIFTIRRKKKKKKKSSLPKHTKPCYFCMLFKACKVKTITPLTAEVSPCCALGPYSCLTTK